MVDTVDAEIARLEALIAGAEKQPSMLDDAAKYAAMTARAGYAGMASPLDIMGLPIRAGEAATKFIYNQFADKPVPYDSVVPSYSGNVAEAVDVATGGIGKPQTTGERLYSAGVSALSGGAGMSSAAQAANAPQKVLNALTVGTKTGAASAVGSGVAAQGAAEVTDNPLLQFMAGVAGGGIPQAMSSGVKGIKNVFKAPDDILSSDELAQQAAAAYKLQPAQYTPTVSKAYIGKLKALSKSTAWGEATQGKEEIQKLISSYEKTGLSNQPMSLQAVQDIDEGLSEKISKLMRDNGKHTKESLALADAQTFLRDITTRNDHRLVVGGKATGAAQLGEARKLWQATVKQRQLEEMIVRANMTQNPQASLQTQVKAILANGKKSRGWTEEEKALLNKVTQSSAPMEMLRSISGRLVPQIMTGTGNVAGGVAQSLVSSGARKLLTQGKTNQILDAQRAITRGVTGAPAPIEQTLMQAATPAIGSNLEKAAIATTNTIQPQEQTMQPAQQPDNIDAEIERLQKLIDSAGQVQGNAGNDTLSSLPDSIKQAEGIRYNSYKDTTGNTTVGYGFNMQSGIAPKLWKQAGIQTPFADVYRGKAAISPKEAEALATVSHQVAIEDAATVYKNFQDIPAHKQEALVNLAYQHGRPALMKLQGFNSAVNKGDWVKAVLSLKNSDYAVKYKSRANNIARALLS